MFLNMNERYTFIFLLGLIWGINFPLSKYILLNFEPTELRYLSGIIGLIITVISFFIFRFKFINLKELLFSSMIGLPAIAIVPALNVFSLSYLNSSTASVLIYTMPSFTSLFIFLLSDNKRNFILLFPAALSISGIFFLTKFNTKFGFGEFIILISAIIWAISGLITGKYKYLSSGTDKFLIQVFAASLATISIFMPLISHQEVIYKFRMLSYFQIFSLIFVCGIASCLAFLFWNMLITNYGAESASYSTLLAPVLGVFIAIIFLHENYNILTIISLLLILLSIYIQQRVSSLNKSKYNCLNKAG